jgi:hypothetical protein
MTRVVRISLLAAIVACAALTLRAAFVQEAPNATRVAIGARQSWCSEDGRSFRMAHTGWIPTDQCYYPVAVPRVQRPAADKVARP